MTKPAITKREVKGTPLTYAELDTNFQNLKDATVSLRAGTGGTTVASDLNGVITLVAGSNITLSGDNTAKTLTINAANESQNIFQNIAVAGQSTVSADTTSDTLTLVAGTNVTITTNASTDTITINSTGGGGGLTDIVNDTSPQLGGNLDVNGRSIVSVSDGNIVLAPNGIGRVQVNGTAIIKGTSSSTLVLGDSAVSTIARIGFASGVTLFSLASGVNKIEFDDTAGILLDTDPGRDIKLTVDSGDVIELAGPLKISSTTGTPTTFENGYYEDMLQTPVSWLKIDIAGSFYYIPLFQ
jgi:hypothetical protein